MMRHLLGLLLAAVMALPALAVQPGEELDDPLLEARARDISKDVRCTVCQNESIDASNADQAQTLRLVIRERLLAGDTNAEVEQFLVEKFGEYVLFKPSFSLANAALWLAGPVLLILGAVAAVTFLRRSDPDAPAAGLSDEERAELDRVLSERRD